MPRASLSQRAGLFTKVHWKSRVDGAQWDPLSKTIENVFRFCVIKLREVNHLSTSEKKSTETSEVVANETDQSM